MYTCFPFATMQLMVCVRRDDRATPLADRKREAATHWPGPAVVSVVSCELKPPSGSPAAVGY